MAPGHDRPATRRAFLERVGSTTACAACLSALPWLSACASVPRVSPVREGRTLRLPLAVFETDPGALVDLPEEGMPIYVHRHGSERFSAVLTRCTHRGCEAEPQGQRIVCPCHGSEYTPDGRVLQGPAEEALQSYAVSVEGETVVIRLDRPGADR